MEHHLIDKDDVVRILKERLAHADPSMRDGILEEIGGLAAIDLDRNLDTLENYLFMKYCVEGDSGIDQIIKTEMKGE